MAQKPEDWKWTGFRATAGKEPPHPCLTKDWILGQFSRSREKAEKEYRQFVHWGNGKESIWTDVKGQVFLGEDDIVVLHSDHLKKNKDIPEIPKSQRYANRPALDKIFNESILKDIRRRDKKIAEAVERHGYTQRAVADHLGTHFTYVSQIIKRLMK